MSRRAWNWMLIAAVVAVALVNPLYRHYKLSEPIVTLGLDLRGGVEVLLQAVPEDGAEPSHEEMQGVMSVVRNRVDPQGQKEVSLSVVGKDRLLLQVPGEKNPDAILDIIGDTALMEWLDTGDQKFAEGTNFNVEGTTQRLPEFAKYNTVLSGSEIQRASVQFDQANRPIIAFELKDSGTQKFGRHTADHIGQFMPILLDGKVISCPKIESAIWGGRGQITGSFTRIEVMKLVTQINAGALPVPLERLSSSVVGPALGQESIDKSFTAGLLGFAIVLVFMILFYRVPGMVAAVALSLYVMLVLGYFSLINATLTLPGIAGLLLSIGMAIDGNIIIFERLKEELRWGKTLVAALEAAFARAWVAILDGNVTTLIGASVLYFYGSGPVKGFAITLTIGILISMFSAVFVTRNLLEMVVRLIPNPKLYS